MVAVRTHRQPVAEKIVRACRAADGGGPVQVVGDSVISVACRIV